MNKKIFISVVVFLKIALSLAYALENKIIYKINNEIITSYDLLNEKKYLIILNPSLKKLDKTRLDKLAKESIINEKIKNLEIIKFFKERDLDDPSIDEIVKDLYVQTGYKSLEDFNKYINSLNLNYNFIKDKISIEMYWNNLIFRKYNNQVKINKSLIEENVKNEIKKLGKLKEFNLSEIVIRNQKDLNINVLYKKILDSAKEIGFDNTANLFSQSNTSKFGGKIGWIKDTSLSPEIKKKIIDLKKGQISKPIKISNNFLILKINDIKLNERKINLNNYLDNRIAFEKNQQLERFSIAHLNKVRKNVTINEL